MYDFSGKTVLITGASSGLGEQFARVLCGVGARVILAARRIDTLEKLSLSLGNAKAVEMDISNKASVLNGFIALEKAGETLDICINNAGIAIETPIFEIDEKGHFESIIQTNLIGTWYVIQQIANHMRKRGIHGSIINIASVNGDAVPATAGSGYSVSKAGVIHLTKTLVGELSPYKIRINCISPGWFRTPMNGPNLDKIISAIPYGNIAEPSDMDGLILYLASNNASQYVTGACFTIDGGISWGGRPW